MVASAAGAAAAAANAANLVAQTARNAADTSAADPVITGIVMVSILIMFAICIAVTIWRS